jgi:hypothetical protein
MKVMASYPLIDEVAASPDDANVHFSVDTPLKMFLDGDGMLDGGGGDGGFPAAFIDQIPQNTDASNMPTIHTESALA